MPVVSIMSVICNTVESMQLYTYPKETVRPATYIFKQKKNVK